MAYFVTGATGFIGRNLVERLLERDGDIYVLVREDSQPRLELLLNRLESSQGPGVRARVHPVIGELTQPLLGVSGEWVDAQRGKIVHFLHLAAMYDMTA